MFKLAFIFAASVLLVVTAKAKFDPYPAMSGEVVSTSHEFASAALEAANSRID